MIDYLRDPLWEGQQELLRTCYGSPAEEDDEDFFCERVSKLTSLTVSWVFFGVASVVQGLTAPFFEDFSYWQGSSREKIPETELRVMTWNVCMLSGGLCIPFGGMPRAERRINAVVQAILRKGVDVVCLQEVGPMEARALFTELQQSYRHFYVKMGSSFLTGLDSGLFVASKAPISNPEVRAVTSNGLFPRAVFTFTASQMRIATTHLDPGLEETDIRARRRQVEEILVLNPDVIIGDLNIERGSEFRGTALSGQFSDSIPVGTETATDEFTARLRPSVPPTKYSIDYILGKEGKIGISSASVCGEYHNRSDHLRVIANIRRV